MPRPSASRLAAPEPGRRSPRHRRWRAIVAWALSAGLLLGYGLLEEREAPERLEAEGGAITLPEEDAEKELIEVVEVRPGEATPGSAVEVKFANTYKDRTEPPTAWLSVTDFRSGKQMPSTALEVLLASEGHLVVRIPQTAFEGRAKLRVGYNKEARSKPYDLRIRKPSYRKLLREVIGGLALLFFGLRVMARGTRQYAGDRGQGFLAHVGRRTPTAVGFGALVGGLTQFTSTAAGLVVGLVESNLVTTGAAVAVLLGAHLGAGITPSVLGLVSTREGLLVLTIGVLWLSLASDRRSEAFGKIVLGCGLLFFGLHLLRMGFEPLVSDPALLPYIDRFDATTASGRLTCVAVGVALAAILQGPAPVFVLVLGLAQSTGRLDLASALCILAGTSLGAAIGTLVVAGPFGGAPARVARVHLALGAAATLLLVASADLFALIADGLVPGAVGEIAYGKRILLPNMSRHLVVGFTLGQLVATVSMTLAIPAALRLLRPRRARRFSVATAVGELGPSSLRADLARAVHLHQQALTAIHDLWQRRERRRGRDGEHLLGDARAELERLFAGAVFARSDDTELDAEIARLRQAALGMVQLQRALEELLRHAERHTEQVMVLSPADEDWKISEADRATLSELHGMLMEGTVALIEDLAANRAPDLDAARSREIRMNACEAGSRQGLLRDAEQGESPARLALRLGSCELTSAYETAGNQLYRVCEALAAEVDQEADEAL